MTVPKNFVYVGLIKFFSCNVNFSLILPLAALIVFTFYILKKFKKRNQYLLKHEQHLKD